MILLYFLLCIQTEYATHSELLWSADVELRWEDYTGRPSYGDSATAITASTIKIFRDSIGKFHASALFIRDQSWVKGPLDDSAAILAHERLHFDITAMFALICERLIKRESNLETCRPIYRKVMTAARNYQFSYDSATDYSNKVQSQRIWDINVRRILNCETCRDSLAAKTVL
jgi:hypothetical protein